MKLTLHGRVAELGDIDGTSGVRFELNSGDTSLFYEMSREQLRSIPLFADVTITITVHEPREETPA